MCAVEVFPVSDTFATEAPEIEVLDDFARLTFWSDQEVEGEIFQVIVARIIVPVEAVTAFLPKPACQVFPFRPRAVTG
jgi:hypothetical protein